MATTSLFIGIILTIGVLLLSLITISKGYGYKHTIDPMVKNNEEKSNDEENK